MNNTSSSSIQTSRRRLLQLLASAPVLPLAGVSASSLVLAGCNGSDDPAPAKAAATLTGVSFSSMPAPTLANAAAMATTTVGSTMTASFSDGSTVDVKLAYQPFFITGDKVSDGMGGQILAGGYYDIYNQPIIDATVAGKERQYFSDAPDGTSLLTVPGAKVAGVTGNTVFAVVQFEYTTWAQDGVTDMYGKLPSPIAVLTLDQNPTTGKLTLVKYHNVDTSGVHGLWITCGASLSPWGTHLSSEEYEPDAFTAAANTQLKAFSKNLYGSETAANPYHYGHLPEVTVNADGTGSIKKHYCLGRISHELVQVMPDNRTVLMGDDATNGGLFCFIANNEKDLSSGTLYVAKVGAGFTLDTTAAPTPLSWIKLGSATSAEIHKLANTTLATDIFDRVTADPLDAGYTKVFVGGKTEWLKLKPGMEKAAAFLETHRYAAYVGASLGFTKMEGTTVNIKDKVAYSALQNCVDSMVIGGKGYQAGIGIDLPAAIKAGAVLQHTLKGGLTDTMGGAINSDWMPSQTKAILTGEDIAADALGNTANPD
ncbi:MAG TPA: alkaline phosphatase PhoX, partial [Fluviicoccus sp.]|nr:alkaline phosphatase PhoX [Fluviicoccus sp.]